MSEQTDMLVPEKPAIVLNTAHARDMMRKRFCAPEWALMEEVAPQTGGGTRYADAVAVNLWQSRGHAIHGFEIKVSRGDWLKELKEPEKAESVFQYCDYWHIVAPKGIIKDGELPPTWGYFELRESGLVQAKAGPKLEPKPIGRAFFASLMRRGYEQIDAIAESKQRRAVMAARQEIEDRVKKEVEQRTRHFKELTDTIAKFEQETGLKIDRWHGPSPAVINLAQTLENMRGYGKADSQFEQLIRLSEQLSDAADKVRKAVEECNITQ